MLGGSFLAQNFVNVDLAPPSTSTANYPGPGSPSPLIGTIQPLVSALISSEGGEALGC